MFCAISIKILETSVNISQNTQMQCKGWVEKKMQMQSPSSLCLARTQLRFQKRTVRETKSYPT